MQLKQSTEISYNSKVYPKLPNFYLSLIYLTIFFSACSSNQRKPDDTDLQEDIGFKKQELKAAPVKNSKEIAKERLEGINLALDSIAGFHPEIQVRNEKLFLKILELRLDARKAFRKQDSSARYVDSLNKMMKEMEDMIRRLK